MYNFLIVEDDPIQAQSLVDLVESSSYGERCDVNALRASQLGMLGDPSSVDVLVVDVELVDENGGLVTGVDIVRDVFDGTRTQVIYVAGNDRFYEAVYQTDHVYLLRKPVDQARMEEALSRAFQRIDVQRKRPIPVRSGKTSRAVDPGDIVYIESDRRILAIHTTTETYRIYGRLKEIVRELPSSFIQPHKSFLANLAHVVDMQPRSLTLDNGESVPISQRRQRYVRDTFTAYVRGDGR